MPATFTIPLITVIPGQTITASLWNNEYGNIYDNFIPSGMDDYSANDTQMQTATDPFPGGSTSRPTSLQGEIERVRFQLAAILGETYWYMDPDVDIATFKSRFDAHTHDGTSNQGPQIAAAGLASNAVTTAKILDANVTTAKIADSNVTDAKIADVATSKLTGTIATAQIADAAVTADKIAAAVAGNGLAGGAGTALSVSVDDSTIEISSDSLRVKDAGVSEAKLATAVVNKLGQNIGIVAIPSATSGTLVSYSGQGRLKGICWNSGNPDLTVTIDGVTLFNGSAGSSTTGLEWISTGLAGTASGKLNAIDVHFKTSLVITINGGEVSVRAAYERQA